MSKTNSNSRGRHKPRHSNNNGYKGSNHPISRNTVFDSNGPCGKVRGNVSQVIEKYQTAAKDAMTQSEYVLAELCLQYADHYNRIALSFAPEQHKKVERNDEQVQNPEIKVNDADTTEQKVVENSETKNVISGKQLNGKRNANTNRSKKITETKQDNEIEIDIENMDLSIPDFSLIEKKTRKKEKSENTVKLAIENV